MKERRSCHFTPVFYFRCDPCGMQVSNPLSLLHGGDPAAHIEAIERQLLKHSQSSMSDISLRLPEAEGVIVSVHGVSVHSA